MSLLQRTRLMIALVVFDIVDGLPAVMRVLAGHLGIMGALGVLVTAAWRSIGKDPLRDVSQDGAPSAILFSRHQFRSVVFLDHALRRRGALSDAERQALVEECIGAAGARFIARNLPIPDRPAWMGWSSDERLRYVRRLLDRFQNSEARIIEVTDDGLAFDVDRCHFAEFANAIGKPSLARAYCVADRIYFDSPESPVRLERTQTLAGGGTSCPFRMRFSQDGGREPRSS